MSTWVPEGSVAYDLAFADGDWEVNDVDAQGSAYFSTIPYKPTPTRNPKLCIGNHETCKGWKSRGTDYCSGHQRAMNPDGAT